MKRLRTGNAELDLILGGGLPAGSLVVIAGEPGVGKTVLAQQIAFANATAEAPVRYYTTLSESHTKLVRHLEGFSFFDDSALQQERLAYLSVTDIGEPTDGPPPFAKVLDTIVREAFEHAPSVVVLDSAKALRTDGDREGLRRAMFDLASRVSHTGAVVILVGEYSEEDLPQAPEFAVADVILDLSIRQIGEHDRRLLRVRKLRGTQYLDGYHVTRITEDGHRLLPRIETLAPRSAEVRDDLCGFGIPDLDHMLGGGLPRGDVSLVSGPTGVGKTLLGLHLIRHGLAEGQRGAFLSVEEPVPALRAKLRNFGWTDLEEAVEDGRVVLLHASPVDLEVDDVGCRIRDLVRDVDPARIVIDGMAELAAAVERIGRGRRAIWALAKLATERGACALFTVETDPLGARRSALAEVSAVFDNSITLQYAEGDAEVHRVVNVLKMRRHGHANTVSEFLITDDGIVMQGALDSAHGLIGYDVMSVDGDDEDE